MTAQHDDSREDDTRPATTDVAQEGEPTVRTRTRTRARPPAEPAPAEPAVASEPGAATDRTQDSTGEAAGSDGRGRRRGGRRTGTSRATQPSPDAGEATSTDVAAASDDASEGIAAAKRGRAVTGADATSSDGTLDAAGETPGDGGPGTAAAAASKPRSRASGTTRRRRGRRSQAPDGERSASEADSTPDGSAAGAEAAASAGTPATPVGADDDASADSGNGSETTSPTTRRRAKRARRGRADRAGEKTASAGDKTASDRAGGDGEGGTETVAQAIARTGTRLAAKKARDRLSGQAGRGQRRAGRMRPTAMPDEMRRAILEGPPRTMLVTSRADRTQIVVLEDRTVVEHYLTRQEDVSYVGNIYMGRVQNVLPGMEAAFLDIGKGRNGVLYAGEVLYDELDVEDGQPQRIERALKPGQKVLVQVTKDPMGTKGARLTMQLSLAGRYMVLAPNDGVFGISRKLSEDERERLRKILKKIKPEGAGVIVRTAAAQASEEQLRDDLERLVRKWEMVQERAQHVEALKPVYEEPDLVVRVIRDHFGPEFEKLIVNDPQVHDRVRDYLEEVMPDAVGKLELYQPAEGEGEHQPTLFEAYHVTEQLRKALEPKVWLPSGGYLVIEKTEAMTIIDVNTGKFTGSTNLEETVLKTNLEAAEEVVRQMRLRDVGGMIVIDFIDMLLPSNQEQVVRRLKRELMRDRTKTRVSEVSKLGLVQMTRKNVSQGLLDAFSERCPHCEGRGYTLNFENA